MSLRRASAAAATAVLMSTVIQSLGEIPAAFPGVTHHAMTGEAEDLFGE